ncbi:MAG: caspase family protein, partial [Planctomycetes bacterium]|nr:caspase family protein [Planctomycetota bacterium]
LRTLRGHTQPVTGVAFSPDGRQAVTASMEGVAILWNPRTGRKLRTFRLSATTPIWSVAFSPDGRYLLTDATLWDVQTGRKLRTFDAGSESVRSVAFSPDGRFALTGTFGPNAAVTLWDGQTGKRLRTFAGHSKTATSVAFSPDARLAASASEDGTAVVWDVQTGRALHTLRGHAQEVRSVAFHPDGRQVLTGSLDETAVVWDAQTGQRLHTYRASGLFPGQEKVWAVAFSPDGSKALAGVGHNAAVLWDSRSKEQILKYEGATTVVGAAAFDGDGRRARMVAGLWGLDWDAATGRPVGGGVALDEIPTSPITAVAFDKDARHVLVSLEDRTDHLYDVQTGRKLQVFRNHAGGLYHVACDPDGRWALTGSSSAAAYLWEVSTGRRHDLAGHAAQPYSVAISSDGRYAATGGFDNAAILWDLASRRRLQTFRATSGVVAVAVRSDGRQVLTAGSDNTASLWDAANGQRVHTLRGHDGWVWCCAFSPDGRYLLTGGWDNKINLWDARAGTLVRSFSGHSGWVTSVQLSPDDRYLLSASFDGTARLWDVATGEEIAALIGLNYANDWLVITPEGLFDGSRIGREMVSFRFGEELNVVPVDRFFQDFYRPGLLSELWRGGRPVPEVQLGASEPPRVKIVAPGRGGVVETDRVALDVELEDRGGGVRGPWLVQNGARLLVPGVAETTGSIVSRRFDVALVEGENRFEIRATSADGSWESEPAVVVLRYERPLPKPELHLVAVGISRYQEESLALEYARGDAEAMVGLFRERGGSLYENVHVTSLDDDRATRAGILETIRDVSQGTNPQDTLVVYLAGHGTVVGSQYYFLPSDFQPETDAAGEDARRQGLPAGDVGEAMATAAALRRLLVFDTGQSGSRISTARTARNPFAFRGAIERLSRTEGAFTIAASAVSDEAGEVPQLGHGILTYTLLA